VVAPIAPLFCYVSVAIRWHTWQAFDPSDVTEAVDALLSSATVNETARAVRSLNRACGDEALCYFFNTKGFPLTRASLITRRLSALSPSLYARLLSSTKKEDSAAGALNDK